MTVAVYVFDLRQAPADPALFAKWAAARDLDQFIGATLARHGTPAVIGALVNCLANEAINRGAIAETLEALAVVSAGLRQTQAMPHAPGA